MYTDGKHIKGGARMSIRILKRSYDIVDGPNVDRLFDACKYAYGCKTGRLTIRIPIHFSVAIGYTLPKDQPGAGYIPMAIDGLVITGIEHTDNSGASFRLQGYCKADLNSMRGRSNTLEPYRFEASYDSKARKGRISFCCE